MMKEEITKVLEMVQAGTISASEGQQLLEAMGAYDEPKPPVVTAAKKPRKLYIRVRGEGNAKVDVALPLNLVKSGLAVGLNIAGNTQLKDLGLDRDEIVKMVEEMAASGETGDIVSVDSGKGDTVHIFME